MGLFDRFDKLLSRSQIIKNRIEEGIRLSIETSSSNRDSQIYAATALFERKYMSQNNIIEVCTLTPHQEIQIESYKVMQPDFRTDTFKQRSIREVRPGDEWAITSAARIITADRKTITFEDTSENNNSEPVEG